MNAFPRRGLVLLGAAALLLAPLPGATLRAAPGEEPAAPVAAGASPGLPYRAATAGKGRLEVLPSGLAVLHLAGTPEEMGTQHGTLLGEAVRHLAKDYLPRVLRGEREGALFRARELEKRIPGRHVREMKALAKAAGVPYDDILLGSVVVELFGLNMCSGVIATGSATVDGATLVGRNLEWPDHGILGAYGLVVAARPEGMRPFLSVGFPALVGVVTGMNGDGVFIAELVVMKGVDRKKALTGIPYPILQRRVLEECDSVGAAEAFLEKAPLTVAQNLMLAGPGGGVVLECGPERFVRRPLVDGFVAVTNHYDEVKTPPEDQGVFDPRFTGLCAAFRDLLKGKVTPESVEEGIKGATVLPFVASMNLQCGVFHPGTLQVRVAAGAPPASKLPMTDLDGAALLGVDAPASRKPAAAGTVAPTEGGKPPGGSK